MSDERNRARDEDAPRVNARDEGQVSEVSRVDPAEAETPIAPEDSTAGYPESESGEPDEGAAGPEAPPPENRRANTNRPRRR